MNPEAFWRALAETTGGKRDYWFPLRPVRPEVPVSAYDVDRLCRDQLAAFQTLLRQQGIRAVHDLFRDDGSVGWIEDLPAYAALRDAAGGLDFPKLAEHYYFDDTRRWLLYVSHEGTIAFAGAALRDGAAALLGPPDWPGRHPRPCCGRRTRPVPREDAVGFICPVCFWESDVFTASDDEPSDCNHGLTLEQGRANYRAFGACERAMLPHVRPPLAEELA